MTQEDIIRMAREAGIEPYIVGPNNLERFAQLFASAEREALEQELLKLKKGVAANRDYIQGRWDLIGEFQDVIRARGQQ